MGGQLELFVPVSRNFDVCIHCNQEVDNKELLQSYLDRDAVVQS